MTTDSEGLYLGGLVGDEGAKSDQRHVLDADDLTTHGVIVGMTGSGKTGLGLIVLEELLRRGTPTLILDPKGDMGNLLLTFPELRPADFAPWVDPGAARREGISVEELGTKMAGRWRDGLADWGLGPAELAALRERAELTIYTPGSTAGVPLNVVGSLQAPDLDWDSQGETLRDEIEGFVSGLLGLVDVKADPLTSREHILLSNLVEHAWREGRSLDLAGLLTQIQRPPLRKLGVFEVDTFFPERDRLALAMKLNGLIASPAFASWLQGPPLDVETLLWSPDGKPRASIVYLAHLGEAERQFVVTLVLSRLITWMRSQAGTSSLRALCYMDEVYGYVPPTAAPPAKKPILTLLKQARAFGVGLVLSTQNPVDLDYKAMSNAGTWMVGRLQTERDKLRILEALRSAGGGGDSADLDRLVGGLGKRQFLAYSARGDEPAVFGTRWAMSFLRGPLTRDEVRRLSADAVVQGPEAEPADEAKPGEAVEPVEVEAAPTEPAPTEMASSERGAALAGSPLEETKLGTASEMPAIAHDVPVYVLDPAASWGRAVGAVASAAGAGRYEAALAARVRLHFDERVADLAHDEEWELVLKPVTASPEPNRAKVVDYDARDFIEAVPAGSTFVAPEGPIDSPRFFDRFGWDLKDFLHRRRSIEIFANRELKLYSRVGEEREAFEGRCDAVAQDRADEEAAKRRDRVESRLDRLTSRRSAALRRLSDAEARQAAERQEAWVEGAGSILDVFLGGRARSRTLARRASRAARGSAGAARRTASARSKLDGIEAEIADLEAELLDEIREIDAEWTEKAAQIEVLEVGLEEDDISVEEVALVWVPVGAKDEGAKDEG